jgi:hypothetical protein
VPDAPEESAQEIWEPLDLPTIEPKPKKIVLDDNFVVNVSLDSRQEADYVRIRSLIATGGDLKWFYRASTKHDRLLKSHQVLHLHLGGPASDAILYVVQYPTYILFVCIDTHVHLESVPPGIRLPVLGRQRFEASLKAKQVTERKEQEAKQKEWAEKLLTAKAKLFVKPVKPKD